MATIKDVARRANVSVTTVSATINGTAPVSDALKARVWAAIREVGYQPDPIARNLRKGVSTTIGLIVPDISIPWAAHLAKSMQRAFSEIGYNMLFASSEDDPEREFSEIEVFSAHRVAGLVVVPTSRGENYSARLVETIHVPTVLVDRVLPQRHFDSVTDDNLLGAQMIVRYLHKLGHRDIAFMAGRAGISSSDERLAGFRRTMDETGVAIREELVRQPVYLRDHAYATVQQLMTMRDPPTAIVCINIAQLLGTMAGLGNLGLSAPDDVSVISFDGFHPAEGWSPAITSLKQDIATTSTRAAELLMARIREENQPEPQIIRVPPSLQIRSSCRAVA